MTKFLQYLFIAFLLFLNSGVKAQDFTIDPDEVTVYVEAFYPSTIAHSGMYNLSDETQTYTWEKHVIFAPAEWGVSVCDNIQCHPPTVDTFETLPIEAGGEGDLKVYFYPFNVEGSALVRVDLWETTTPDVVVSGTFYANTAVGISEKLSEAIAIYPNPATDVVRIAKGDIQVEQFELFDMSGKQTLSVPVGDSDIIDVSAIPAGNYIARMFDDAGKQISSNVLIKQ